MAIQWLGFVAPAVTCDLPAIDTVWHVGALSTRTLLRCVDDEASKRLLQSPGNFPLGVVQVKDPDDVSRTKLLAQLVRPYFEFPAGNSLPVGGLHGAT